jgi:hypothetical protein
MAVRGHRANEQKHVRQLKAPSEAFEACLHVLGVCLGQ